jgi:type I restriction enzyme S subunit
MSFDLPHGWKRRKIRDIAEVVGGSTPDTKDSSNYGGSIPWITVKDLSQHNKRYIFRGERNITEKGLKAIGNRLIPKGSLLISSRAPIGYLAIAGTDLTTNQGIRSLVFKHGCQCDPEFVYYLIKHNVRIFENFASGSTFREITGSTIEELEFVFPPYPEQRKIAEILGSLDDKIELNYEMNKTLEAIAQAIFENWFVDFEPFEDELAYNEELGEEIPRGWEVVRIGDFVHVEKGVSYKSEDLKARSDVGLVNLKCILPGGGFRNEVKPYSGKFEPKHVLRIGDIVVAITDLTQNREVIGMPARIYPVETFKKLVLSLDLVALRIKDEKTLKQSFLYYLLLTPRYKGYVNGCAYGTTVRHLKPTDILNFKFALPPYEWIAKFAEIADSIFDLLVHNFMEIRVLEEIRDALLPKLLSGEIRVKVDVEEEFPEETKKLEDIGRKKAKIQVSLEEWLRHG